tara:strand:- start:283 stop:645 length:363 start_codon:yes stop_codon:yes gene_type:complete
METRVSVGLTEFIGLADAHGIESFMSRKEANARFETLISIRAGTNRQRHAVCFAALLTESGEKAVNAQMEAGDFIEALNVLRAVAMSLVCEEGWEKSWKLIPNPKLDPWWSEPKPEEDDE